TISTKHINHGTRFLATFAVRYTIHNVRIIDPFFFDETSITANVYLDLLTEYVAPQLLDLQPTIIFQQDDAPPHWGLHIPK
ncbi:hypothetical protein K0M31_011084, partial [Melipona bicolor]